MNKFKSFLCGLLTFMVCAVLFVGCGTGQPTEPTPPTTTTTTISLAEAKAIILNALVLDGQGGVAPQSVQTGNRDFLEKLGKFTFTSDEYLWDVDKKVIDQEYHSRGNFEYANYDFVSYYLCDSEFDQPTSEVCLADGTVYVNNLKTGLIREQNKEAIDWANILNCFLTEESFNYVYKDEVQKVTTNAGFSLSLIGDIEGYMRILALLTDGPVGEDFDQLWESYSKMLEERYSQAIIDECHVLVQINFDKNENIIGADAEMFGLSPQPDGKNIQNKESFHVVKTDEEFTQPQWLTDYLAGNN